jgi:hypothetical protein
MFDLFDVNQLDQELPTMIAALLLQQRSSTKQ